MLVEVDAGVGTPAVNNPLRRYTWGLDLGGTAGSAVAAGHGDPALQSAGGVGGLLAMQDANGTPWNPGDDLNYVYLYDANGNVGQLADWSHDPNDPAGAIVAKYEYDPYGKNLLTVYDPNESGPYANQNPFRFSTKYFDAETGLSYFGYRYYNASLGRWINRDPIGELGGANVYAMALNDPINFVDCLGLMAALGCGHNGHECPPPDTNDDDGWCPRKGKGGPRTQPDEWGPEGPELRPWSPDDPQAFVRGLHDLLGALPEGAACGPGCQWLRGIIQDLINRMNNPSPPRAAPPARRAVIIFPGMEGTGAWVLAGQVWEKTGAEPILVESEAEFKAAMESGVSDVMIISHGTGLDSWFGKPMFNLAGDSLPALVGGGKNRPLVIFPSDVAKYNMPNLQHVELFACYQGYGTRQDEWQSAFGENVKLDAYETAKRPIMRYLRLE